MTKLARRMRSRFRADSRPGQALGRANTAGNRTARAGRLRASRPSPRSGADACFKMCCGIWEPDGTDCSSAKVTKPGTWSCMIRCLKLPEPSAPGLGGLRTARATGPKGARLRRRAPARLRNPGPHGEALPVPPFCAAGDCGRLSCGRCNPAAYAVPGRVDTVREAVEQMRQDVAYAVRTAAAAERRMYAPGALAWADPSVAVLTKPGGPPPGNALPTAEWPHCIGPAVAADPSSNRQPTPGGTP